MGHLSMKSKFFLLPFVGMLLAVLCFSTAFAADRIAKDSAAKSYGSVFADDDGTAQAGTNFSVAIEKFQVRTVRVYPVYIENGEHHYDTNNYVEHTISSSAWGQNNFLHVSPETTKKLLNSYPGKKVVGWHMEMACVVSNYKRPNQFIFKPCGGGNTIIQGAWNGTTQFTLDFPVEDTENPYYNGLEGSFTYYTTSGKLASLMAGGRVYFNSANPDAQ